MLLIVDNKTIHRVRGTQFTIGSADEDTIRLPGNDTGPGNCEFFQFHQAGSAETWRVVNRGPAAVHRGGQPVAATPDSGEVVDTPFEIRVGGHVVEAVGGKDGGGIGERLRAAAFEIERRVQLQILNQIQFSPATGSMAEESARLEHELAAALEKMGEIPMETSRHMAVQALAQLLTDRIEANQLSRASWRSDESKPWSVLISQLETGLGVQDDDAETEKLERIERLLPKLLQRPGYELSAEQCRDLAKALIRMHLRDLIFGFGPLEDLLVAPDVNDIMVLPSGSIFVERSGQMQDSGRVMFSPKVATQIVDKIVSAQGREINQSSPMVDARLADGSRLNAIIEPLSISGPALTIRRFSVKRMGLDDLTQSGTLTPGVKDFLAFAVKARKSMVISGGTGSGKTTLLNALSEFIPPAERVITIEDTAEIKLARRHVISLQSRPPNRSGKGEVTVYDLVRNSLRMRPDRIIVGECRGGETLDMLQAMNTGHEGSMTTVHANTPEDALRRLEVLAMSGKTELPLRSIRAQVASAIDLIVQIGRIGIGSRKILSVCEVVGYDEEDDRMLIEEIFSYRARKNRDGPPSDRLHFTGYLPSFFDSLQRAGAEVKCFY